MTVYEFPESLSVWIDKHLKTLGFNLNQSQKLAKHILNASNDYQEVSSVTPWGETQTMAAYLAYFFPLNYIRTLKVMDEAKKWNFFDGVKSAVDYGCGPGTTTKAFINDSKLDIPAIHGTDLSKDLTQLYLDTPRASTQLSFSGDIPKVHETGSLLAASYVFNELKEIPSWLFNFEKIMIIEPSTKQFFPTLLKLREELLKKKYNVIAPCPHSHTCPLQESKRDWCHDRVHWKQPDWFQKIESHLPIKNRTLTYSYLLAQKTPLQQPSFGRIVGDSQIEKGKTRWMICQGPEREFLSFLKRQGEAPELHRGDRVQLELFEKRGDEIRFEKEKLTII